MTSRGRRKYNLLDSVGTGSREICHWLRYLLRKDLKMSGDLWWYGEQMKMLMRASVQKGFFFFWDREHFVGHLGTTYMMAGYEPKVRGPTREETTGN